MYEWNYFYGAIMLDMDYASSPFDNYEDAIDFIQHKLAKKEYQYFHPKIFSTATKEIPFYYDNILITFGRTGKWLFFDSSELLDFIKEFEDILSNLDFENAQIKIASPLGDYTLFWCNKSKIDVHRLETTLEYFLQNQTRYYESSKFYFGFGEINLSTGWNQNKYDEEKLISFDLQFPDFNYQSEN